MFDENTNLPNVWFLTTLGQLGEWSSGGTPSRSHSEYYGGDIPWIKTGNLPDGLIEEIDENITWEGLANSSAKVFPKNSLIVAMYGATIGKLGILKESAATNQACAALLSKGLTTEIIPYVFYYLLNRREDLRSIGQGGAQPNISQTVLKEYFCPLPPLNEQRRIVAKIEALKARSQRVKEELEAIASLLDQFRQSVLAAAFRGDLTADWREKNPDVEPASVLLERIRAERRRGWEEAEQEKMKAQGKTPKDDKWKEKYEEIEPIDTAKLPELPEGWCWAAAAEIVEPNADIVYGIVQPGPHILDGIPYVRGQDIQDGKIVLDQLKRTSLEIAKRYARAALRGGDVLLGIIRATKVAIVPEELTGGNITQGTARFRPSTVITTAYLAGWLEAPFTQDWLHAHYRGIDMPGLNLRDVRRLPIPLAPLKEQLEFARKLEDCQMRINIMEQAATSASDQVALLDRSILAKAFRGELVPQDPNDEPAAVLLERIRAERENLDTKKKAKGKTEKKSRKAKPEAAEPEQLSLPGFE
jgi:type I restriction enzyme S subunit